MRSIMTGRAARVKGEQRTSLPICDVDSPDVSWRAQGTPGTPGTPGALGVLMTLCLTLLLVAGQAPYDWAWSRGQHATPAQWRAHERYEQRGEAHHGPTDSVSSEKKAISRSGTWLEDGGHDAHAPGPDGVQAGTDGPRALRPAVIWRRLVSMPAALPSAPSWAPPIQPPRFTS